MESNFLNLAAARYGNIAIAPWVNAPPDAVT
jgi:hypothetical protein